MNVSNHLTMNVSNRLTERIQSFDYERIQSLDYVSYEGFLQSKRVMHSELAIYFFIVSTMCVVSTLLI
jgi:hypothetical protein